MFRVINNLYDYLYIDLLVAISKNTRDTGGELNNSREREKK